MARAALRWSLLVLAERAQVGATTINRFETDQTTPNRATLAAIQRAFEDAGIVFIAQNGGGPGVRLPATADRAAPEAPP
jgi:transcriptional regulator with XRE-family HTH domain